MANEFGADDPMQVWQNQPVESVSMSVEEIRNKALKFEGRIRWRNKRETIAALVAIGIFIFYIVKFPSPAARTGSALVIAGLIYVIWRMNGMAAPATTPVSMGFDTWVGFHRRELERQRDALRSIWRWYLLPMLPGILVFSLGVILPKMHRLADVWRAAPFSLMLVAFFWFVIQANLRGARRLQEQIDELDRAAGQ
jgi:hypothetical protein